MVTEEDALTRYRGCPEYFPQHQTSNFGLKPRAATPQRLASPSTSGNHTEPVSELRLSTSSAISEYMSIRAGSYGMAVTTGQVG